MSYFFIETSKGLINIADISLARIWIDPFGGQVLEIQRKSRTGDEDSIMLELPEGQRFYKLIQQDFPSVIE